MNELRATIITAKSIHGFSFVWTFLCESFRKQKGMISLLIHRTDGERIKQPFDNWRNEKKHLLVKRERSWVARRRMQASGLELN